MKAIQYISDIHLELRSKNQIQAFLQYFTPKANTLVLAGDIGNPYQPSYHEFLHEMSTKFEKIFLIAGNHEYYGNDITETQETIQSLCDNYRNISFLNNSYEDYDDYIFIGTTLWTNINKPQYTINDTRSIKDFTVGKYNKLHEKATGFLTKTLEDCTRYNKKAIVITHHLPFYELTHPEFRNEFYKNYNQWFHAKIEPTVETNHVSITAWIYGHTHKASIQKHYDVPFYCNPLGYTDENPLNESVNKVFHIL
jgi:predicted phosphodiesterase